MITIYSFEVPKEKEELNFLIKKFINSNISLYDYDVTKDGFCYSIEFNSENEKKNFKSELEKRFPNIYF